MARRWLVGGWSRKEDCMDTFNGSWVARKSSETFQILHVVTCRQTGNQHSLEWHNESAWCNLVIESNVSSEMNPRNPVLDAGIT